MEAAEAEGFRVRPPRGCSLAATAVAAIIVRFVVLVVVVVFRAELCRENVLALCCSPPTAIGCCWLKWAEGGGDANSAGIDTGKQRYIVFSGRNPHFGCSPPCQAN